ncbi:MAG: choice-of-anchor B family protein [Gammaproteobacteria bacterium]|nr:choice-of-anchor B family protein [Gammaproteobacteria bacterium]MDH4315123.1 choice-of-anchor B family protein [Gammaproteobacteria bacterium]MDH5214254.1 choice-of-anchor B family protein [Gammaproteobacteria bacterium]MDH5500455.1 choice-of-anchor B family protein [Gammaproteobacteria bacterium]
MKRVICRLIAAAVLPAAFLFFSNAAFSHGDTEKPLFVAADGIDSGSCDNASSPCASIAYVLKIAGKGAQIRVAAGTYPVENAEDLFHLVSGTIEVSGGYRRDGGFAARGTDASILTGVPQQFRELLRSRGFHVIPDRKAIDGPKAEKALQLLGIHEQLKAGMPATPCINGVAGVIPCNNMDLLAHIELPRLGPGVGTGNDVWGFVDLNSNREYVIAGTNIGTAVIDVTDPENPREVGFIDGQNASWRDIKVYQRFDESSNRWQAYAYVTTDGSTDGLFAIDLSALPHRIIRGGYSSDYFSAHNVFATGVDFSTGVSLAGVSPSLIIAGSNLGGGQFRRYSLANPDAPAFISGASSSADYMHDAASLVITDSRKDTQCVSAGNHCEVLLDFNESTFDLWDISNASNPQRLSRTPYNNAGYTHSGWPTEDGRYVFLHDELDEQRFGLSTTVRVFSIANLATPSLAGSWTGPTTAIDHNGFVRGNRYYMSNYARGLTVLDISNPATPVEVGRFDSYPFSDSGSFVGAWGTFPYLHSRVVAISDINYGIYLVADRTLDVPQGRLQFASASFGTTEGSQASLLVQRLGGSSGNASVDYQLVPATASAADYTATTGTLSWGPGDTGDRSIDISAVSDGVNESLERVLVNLVNPGGGASLGDIATASLYIGDAGAAAGIRFVEPALELTERGFGTAVVVLHRIGSAGGAVSVDFALTGGDAGQPDDFTGPASGTVSWADGDADPKWIEFAIVDDGISENTEFFEVMLSNPVGATLDGPATVTVNIENGDGLNQAPNAVAGAGQSVTGGIQVTLDGSSSNDPNGDPLTFQWSQTGGPTVTISNANSAIAQFTAPTVQSDTLLQFRLAVQDSAGLTDFTSTTVVVRATGGGNSVGGGGGGLMSMPLMLILGLLALLVSRKDAGGLSSARGPAPLK